MKKKWIKILLPVAVIGAGVVGMTAIKATADVEEAKEVVDTRPTVKIDPLLAENYQVTINSFGEVLPLESTQIAAQVSGEVISWHPEFVAGGLVKRGDVLFTIEKDSYEAALLQAEADLSLAEAELIEELAKADVAKNEAKKLNRKVSDLYLRKPQVMSAKAKVKSAKARLKIAQRDLDNCEVVAPYDALVIRRDIGVGQFVSQGSAIAELNNIEYAEITIPVAGFDSSFLPHNLHEHPAKIANRGLTFAQRDGVIVRDLGVIDQNTRMTQLVVRIEDPYSLKSDLPALKYGSYVEVSFAGITLENVFKLPQELVTNKEVWVVENERLQSKQVTILREEGEYFLISDGISSQDKLVMTVPEYPQNGQQVKTSTENTELVVQVGE